jgi:VanZ family protein
MAHDSPRRSRLAIAICVVTGLYWMAIFALTHSPVVPMPKIPVRAIDKIAHLSVFAGLAFLLCAAGTAFRHPPRRVVAAVFAIVAAYGAFDELTQQLVPDRFSDFHDWIADMIGAGIGITAFVIAREAWLAMRRVRTVPNL